MTTTNSVPLPVSELSASSEMIREDLGDTISAIRSNVSCGIAIRSSAAFAPLRPVAIAHSGKDMRADRPIGILDGDRDFQDARAGLLTNPKTNIFDYFVRTARAAAPALAIEIVPLPIESSDTDIERAVASFASTPNGALVVPPDPTTLTRRDFVVALSSPVPSSRGLWLSTVFDAGGLMCYGVDLVDLWRLSASYVDRILRGANPADLPVQAPTKYETVVNLKTAKALGLDVPSSLLVRADAVIE